MFRRGYAVINNIVILTIFFNAFRGNLSLVADDQPNDEENLHVLDERLRNIRVFDKNGEFVRYIGGIGQGPGEFQNPCYFIFYSLQGRHLKEKLALYLGIPIKIRIDSKGNPVFFFSGLPPAEELKKFDSHDLKVAQPSFGDTYMATILSRISKRPISVVAQEYEQNKGQGWGVMAMNMGIKPGSPEFKQMKANGRDSLGHMKTLAKAKKRQQRQETKRERDRKIKDKAQDKGRGKGKKK